MESNKSIQVLKSTKEFERLRETGRRLRVTHWMLFSYNYNDKNSFRYGFTIPKYVGIAVVRNRVRRWGREFFRALAKNQTTLFSCDINVVFLKKDREFYKALEHSSLDKALSEGLRKIAQPN